MNFISFREFRVACALVRAPFRAYRAEGAHAQVSNCMALSAEPGRKAAYDKDLRWRIIYQRIAMGMKFSEIAKKIEYSC